MSRSKGAFINTLTCVEEVGIEFLVPKLELQRSNHSGADYYAIIYDGKDHLPWKISGPCDDDDDDGLLWFAEGLWGAKTPDFWTPTLVELQMLLTVYAYERLRDRRHQSVRRACPKFAP